MSWTPEDAYYEQERYATEGVFIPSDFVGEVSAEEYGYRRFGQVERAESATEARERVSEHDRKVWTDVTAVRRKVTIIVTEWEEF